MSSPLFTRSIQRADSSQSHGVRKRRIISDVLRVTASTSSQIQPRSWHVVQLTPIWEQESRPLL